MRVMVFVKATKDSEEGVKNDAETAKMFEEMGRYNAELIKAGIMKDGDGLKPSSFAKRVKFDGANRIVVDGPFGNPNDLVAGFWVWEVKDMAEAVEWVKKCPNPMPGPSEIEIRPYYEMQDFEAVLTPEAKRIHAANTQ